LKKTLGLALILLAFAGCESSEGEWDKLGQADQDYIRNRATQQCLDEEAANFENFRVQSELFFGSIDYPREKSYTSKLNDSGNNATEERLIRIWKNTAAYVIFYVEETIGTVTDKYFVQIVKNDTDTDYTNDTFGYNNSMIEALKYAFCRKQIELTPSDSGPITASRTLAITLSSGGRKETKTTHVYSFADIAYWTFWKRSITIKDIDSEDTVTATKNFTSTFSENANPPVFTTTDYTTLTTKLCYVDPASYALPYTLKCDGTYAADMAP
jgi:hypothetical protein